MRRLAPRPLRAALEEALPAAAPAGLLARVQAAWPEVAGPVMAQETAPVSESQGVVKVACSSAVWAQELELLSGELTSRLNERIASSAGGPEVARLRFAVGRL